LIIAANSGRSQLVDRESRVDCNFAESWYDFPQNKSAQRAGREICRTFQIVWGCCDEAELNKKQAERKKQSYLRHGCGASLRQAARLGQGGEGNKKETPKKGTTGHRRKREQDRLVQKEKQPTGSAQRALCSRVNVCFQLRS
jgi:hypothetical protein